MVSICFSSISKIYENIQSVYSGINNTQIIKKEKNIIVKRIHYYLDVSALVKLPYWS